MKRNLFSSIFSIKILGIVLFIVLSFFSFTAIKTEAAIVTEVRLNGENKKVFVTENTVYIVEIYTEADWLEIIKTLTTRTVLQKISFVVNNTVTNIIISPTETLTGSRETEARELVLQQVESERKKAYERIKKDFDSYLRDINNNSNNSYPEAQEYLRNVLDTALDFASPGTVANIYNEFLKYKETSQNIFTPEDVRLVAVRLAAIYLEGKMADFLNGKTTLDTNKIPENLNSIAKEIQNDFGENLTETEKKTGESLYKDVTFKARKIESPGDYGDENNRTNDIIKDEEGSIIVDSIRTPSKCTVTSFGQMMITTEPECSIVAWVINSFLNGLSKLIGLILDLMGNLLNWSFDFSIIKFKDWILMSGAYNVWRNIVLALATSIILPIILYLIIRMLIDNSSDQIKKVLPKVLFMALFVYFSFNVVGWLIDQSNVFSIYVYETMTGSGQNLGISLRRLLELETSEPLEVTTGGWDTTPYHFIKVIVNIVGLFVILQAIILLFIRAVILLLCTIFSPLMLLPADVNKYMDKYREMVIKHFTTATISAPIFLFLVMVGITVSEAATGFIRTDTELGNFVTNSDVTFGGSSNFIGITLSAIISIIIFQLAITVAKEMSEEIGGQVSGKVSGFMGNMAFGGTAKAMRFGANQITGSKTYEGWMQKKEGTRTGKALLNFKDFTRNSTFDARNTKGFQTASKLITKDQNYLGKGTQATYEKSFRKQYAKEKRYHDSLTTEEGREKNLNRLRTDPISIINHGKEIADRLESRNSSLTIDERIENEKVFNSKFNKTNEIKDIEEREKRMKKVIDEHFKDNGLGEKHFSESLEKSEYKDIKEDFKKAVKETDSSKRKEEIINVVKKFEEKEQKLLKTVKEEIKKEEKTGQPATETKPTEKQTTSTPASTSASAPTPSSDIKRRATGELTEEEKQRIQTTRARLMEKYGSKVEKTKDGQTVTKSFDPQVLRKNIQTHKEKQEKIAQQKYQEKSLAEAKEREKKLYEEAAELSAEKEKEKNKEDFYKAVPELKKEMKTYTEALRENTVALLRNLKEKKGKPEPLDIDYTNAFSNIRTGQLNMRGKDMKFRAHTSEERAQHLNQMEYVRSRNEAKGIGSSRKNQFINRPDSTSFDFKKTKTQELDEDEENENPAA